MKSRKVLPFVSVVIPIRNESNTIKNCLNAVVNQNYSSSSFEIIIADGMSIDNTRSILSQICSQTPQIIEIVDNLGKIVPTGLNLALSKAKGEIIIRVDGHCIIAPDYVRKCVEHIQNDGVDGVGGPMETVGETYLARSIALGMSSPFGVGNSAFRTTNGKSMLVDTVPFPAYTRAIIERVGLYDEELVRNQDDEYNYRIRAAGGKILLADDVRSTYFSRASLKGLWRQYFQYGYWKVRVLQKHPRQMRPRQFVPPAFVMALLGSAFLALIPVFRPLSPAIPVLYLIANLSASVWTAARRSAWQYLPLLPLVYAILHLSYGLGFLAGLVRFWNRWSDRVGRVPAFDPGA